MNDNFFTCIIAALTGAFVGILGINKQNKVIADQRKVYYEYEKIIIPMHEQMVKIQKFVFDKQYDQVLTCLMLLKNQIISPFDYEYYLSNRVKDIFEELLKNSIEMQLCEKEIRELIKEEFNKSEFYIFDNIAETSSKYRDICDAIIKEDILVINKYDENGKYRNLCKTKFLLWKNKQEILKLDIEIIVRFLNYYIKDTKDKYISCV